jgi:hypothetical protein
MCSDKCKVSDWTRLYEQIFKRAGVSIQEKGSNLILVAGHANNGAHGDAYNAYVYARVANAVGSSTGTKARILLREELSKLGEEINRPGSAMRELLRLP